MRSEIIERNQQSSSEQSTISEHRQRNQRASLAAQSASILGSALTDSRNPWGM